MAAVHRLPIVSSAREAAVMPSPPRRVALVCMPFQAVELPSIALGTLSQLLRDRGHHVDVVHFNLDFAAHIGLGAYEDIASYGSWLRLLGEWLFSDEHVAPGAADLDRFRAQLVGHRWRDRSPELERFDLVALRAEVDCALDRWFGSRDWASYDVVGFTLMFQQLNASLRLGSRIKQAHPHVRVVLGGSALETPMGQPVLDRHPWLDAVFGGYAERTLPDYVAALPARVDRVITQEATVDLDELPIPSFDEFFRDTARLGLDGAAEFSVPIETSRGCWWGEKQHCIFCALNALDMKQRNKSTSRATAEIVAQARYRRPFFATDNILPLEFFDGLFPRLLESKVPFDTFYETKSNLDLAQLRMLRRVGVTCIQPGIESLSTPILKYMKKGVSAAQNLWILRAAEELGLGVAWSILYGFPEEDPIEYDHMAAMLPSLAHLPPPLRPAPVLLERHSPLFDRAKDYDLRNVRPTEAHRSAFGAAPGLSERAYVFDFDYGDAREPDAYTVDLNRGVAAWMQARRRLFSPRCEVFDLGGRHFVFDTRALEHVGRSLPRVHLLNEAEWALVQLTEELVSESKLRAAWTRDESLDEILESFLRRRYVIRLDNRLVRILMTRERPTIGAELLRAARGGLRRAERFVRRVKVRCTTKLVALRAKGTRR